MNCSFPHTNLQSLVYITAHLNVDSHIHFRYSIITVAATLDSEVLEASLLFHYHPAHSQPKKSESPQRFVSLKPPIAV